MNIKRVCLRLLFVLIVISITAVIFGCGSSGGSSNTGWGDSENIIRVSNLKGRVIPPLNNNINSLRGSSTQPYFSLVTTQGATVFIEDDSSLNSVADSDGFFVIPNVPEGKHRVIANIVSGTTSYRQRSDIINVTGQFETQELPYSVELVPALYYIKFHLSDLATGAPIQGKVNIWGFTFDSVNGVVDAGPFPDNQTSKEVKITAIGYKDLNTLINFGEDYKSDIYIKMTPTTSTDSNQAPIISIQQTSDIVRTNEQIGLLGVGVDPEGDRLTWKWSADLGKFYNPNSQQTTYISPSVGGTDRITLSATDSKGATGQAVLTINITQSGSPDVNPQNQPPTIPNTPFPDNYAKGINNTITLNWQCSDPENEEITYSVYFGKNINDLKIATNTVQNSFSLSKLESNTTYYWQISAYDEHYAMSTSDIWQFTTKSSAIINQPPNIPSSPFPADKSKGIDEQHISFGWEGDDPDGDSVIYKFYLATFSSLIDNASTELTHIQSVSSPNLELWGFAKDSTYQWQIISQDSKGDIVEGPVWEFSTVEKDNTTPSNPIITEPASGAIDVALDQKLRWTATDGDGDTLYYDVYFGTTPEPELVSASQPSQIYIPEKLENGTTYYWKIIVSDGKVANKQSELWSFTTEKIPDSKPSVVSIRVPTSNSTSLKIVFSEYINNISKADEAFCFSPEVAGNWSWSEGNTVAEFKPDGGWLPGSYNKFTLIENILEDATGNKIENGKELKFDVPSSIKVPDGYHSVAFPRKVAANTTVSISVPDLAYRKKSYVIAIADGDSVAPSGKSILYNTNDPTYKFRLQEAELMDKPIDSPKSSLRASVARKEVGDIRTFHISGDGRYFNIQAKLVKMTDKTAIYVDEALEDSDDAKLAKATEVLNKFENEIKPTVNLTFGDEPPVGVDGDSRMSIVLLDIDKNTIGYFWAIDLYENRNSGSYIYSNEGKFLYMDYNISGSNLYGTIAHEFQHMINYYQKNKTLAYDATRVNEDTWINEGLSMFSEEVCGYSVPQGDRSTLNSVKASMDNNKKLSLTEWSRSPNTANNYGQVYLFMHYFTFEGRYNSTFNITRSLVNGNGQALSGVSNIMAISNEPFKDTIAKYAISLFINDYESTDPKSYSINGINLKGIHRCNDGSNFSLPGYKVEDATNPITLSDMPFDNSIRFFYKTSSGNGDTTISITTGTQPVTLYLLDERD